MEIFVVGNNPLSGSNKCREKKLVFPMKLQAIWKIGREKKVALKLNSKFVKKK